MVSFKLFEGDRQIDIYIYRYEHTHCEGGGGMFKYFFLQKQGKNGYICQGWRGHWTINFTGTQSFLTTLSYLQTKKLWVPLFKFYLLVSNFSTIDVEMG